MSTGYRRLRNLAEAKATRTGADCGEKFGFSEALAELDRINAELDRLNEAIELNKDISDEELRRYVAEERGLSSWTAPNTPQAKKAEADLFATIRELLKKRDSGEISDADYLKALKARLNKKD